MIITNTYWELSRHQTLCLTRKDCTRKDCQSVYRYGNWGSEQGCDLLCFTPWGSDWDRGLAPRCHGCQPDFVGLSVCTPGGSGGEITEWKERSFLLLVPWSPRTQNARVMRTSWASGLWDNHCVYRWAHLAQQGKGTCRRSNSELGLFACVGLSLPEAQLFIDTFFSQGEHVSETGPSVKANEHGF